MQYESKSNAYFGNTREEMQLLLPETAKTVLDVGCGMGAMSRELKKKHDLEIWGVEFMREESLVAQKSLDKVINSTAEDCIEHLPDNYFDAIYLNDVLEHLADPEKVLIALKSKLTENGSVISSIPNARYHVVFKEYVFGRDWKYKKAGVMDYTHLRFFTSISIRRMYEKTGYKIKMHKGINKTKSLKPYFYNLLLFFTGSDLFYVQYATIAQKDNNI